MLNLFKVNDRYRQPNATTPNFTPDKNQGEKLQGPGPVISISGATNPLQGPGPAIIGPGGPGPGGPGGPGPGGGPWNQPHHKLRPCTGKFTYIWLNNGSEFWFYVQSVTPRYLFGWRIRRGRWERGRIAINRIDTFYCNRRD